MPNAGHVLIGSAGQLIAVDQDFCEIMHASAKSMEGRLVLDVTAPADREECATAIQHLRETGESFEIVKRFLRDDGTLQWVRNTVSITLDGGLPDMIVATIEPVEEGRDDSPATLRDCARYLLMLQEERESVLDPLLLSDVSWSVVLAIYVAEAEGKVLDSATIATLLDRPTAIVGRWIRALTHHGVLEIEMRGASAETAKIYRLTCEAHRLLEQHLGRVKPSWRATANPI